MSQTALARPRPPHLPSPALTYCYLPILALTCPHLPSPASPAHISSHLSSPVLTSPHLPSLALTCVHLFIPELTALTHPHYRAGSGTLTDQAPGP